MATSQKGRIFISYRRTDSAGYAGRIYDRLAAYFGEETLFMDVDTIEAGVDFVEVLEDAVQSCDVLIAVIGSRWLSAKDSDGKRRLDNPEDFVRIEITAALKRDVRVVPVLLNGTDMPSSDELPDELKKLARRNAIFLNHYSFHTDTNRLISQLELALQDAKTKKLFFQAQEAIDQQIWQLAQTKLESFLALEPNNPDALSKLTFVKEQQSKIKPKRPTKENSKPQETLKTKFEQVRKQLATNLAQRRDRPKTDRRKKIVRDNKKERIPKKQEKRVEKTERPLSIPDGFIAIQSSKSDLPQMPPDWRTQEKDKS